MKHGGQHISLYISSFLYSSLVYNPCQDCSGIQYVNLTMYEEQPDPDITPTSTNDIITINVLPVNDPPVIFLFHQGQSILNEDPTEPVTVCCFFKHRQ